MGVTLFDDIYSLCRLDHRIGGCARFDGGCGACSRWILPLQEKKLKLSENGVIVQSALTIAQQIYLLKDISAI